MEFSSQDRRANARATLTLPRKGGRVHRHSLVPRLYDYSANFSAAEAMEMADFGEGAKLLAVTALELAEQ